MAVFRLLRVSFEILRFALWSFVERFGPSRGRSSGPKRLCAPLSRLGVTYVKIGQALSLRQDVLPPDYIVALQSLQDRVPPLAPRDARREIERGLGHPVDRLFVNFERTPLAAASIAQVQPRACRTDGRVIVKVRPVGLPARLKIDLRAAAAGAGRDVPWLKAAVAA